MVTFLKKAFPVQKYRIMQGILYAALLCSINLLSPLMESVKLPVWGAVLLLLLWIGVAVCFLWAGRLFQNLEIVGWTAIGYTVIGAVLTLFFPDRFGKILLTGLCVVVVYIGVYYTMQKRHSL